MFECLMEGVLRGLHWQVAVVYLDDVIVWKDFDEHFKRLATILERFQETWLKLKPKKCNFSSERCLS